MTGVVTYPNGMTGSYAHNNLGQATGLAYVKTTGRSEKPGSATA